MLFGWPLGLVLSGKRLDQRAIFAAVFPGQDRVLRQQAVLECIVTGEFVIAAPRLGKRRHIIDWLWPPSPQEAEADGRGAISAAWQWVPGAFPSPGADAPTRSRPPP